ncbi:MAG: hypothetical protein WDO73_16075 [Ignavibacteriota bacterium]
MNTAVYQQSVDPDGLGVTFEYSDGHATARKTFRFQKDSYLSEITSELNSDGQPVTNFLQWRGGFGDFTISNPAANQKTIYFDPSAPSSLWHPFGANLQEQAVSVAKKRTRPPPRVSSPSPESRMAISLRPSCRNPPTRRSRR